MVEFWSGSNPIFAEAKPIYHTDGSVTLTKGDQSITIVPAGKQTFLVKQQGKMIGQGQVLPNGDLKLTNTREKRAFVLKRQDALAIHQAL